MKEKRPKVSSKTKKVSKSWIEGVDPSIRIDRKSLVSALRAMPLPEEEQE